MSAKKLRLGLFGFGCVGQGLYNALEQSEFVKAEVGKVCVKNPNKKRSIPDELLTLEKEDILEDESIDVVVELIDDAEAAYGIVKKALQKGKAVVSANKKMIAENLEELLALQKKHKKALLYEGSCCASIPIIRNLEEYYDNDLVQSVEGIFNGSTNYILSKILEEELSFDDALSLAKDRGFAESDPSLDIEGYDPKYKLCIILAHAFGVLVDPTHIHHYGIHKLSEFDIRYAREKGYQIKLIAKCFKSDDTVHAYVAPQFVEKPSSFTQVQQEYNGVSVEGAFSENQFFVGKGAGSLPTGAAVLSDISALSNNYKYAYKKHSHEKSLHFSNDLSLRVYVSAVNHDDILVEDFDQIHNLYDGEDGFYLIGSISIEKLFTAQWLQAQGVNFIELPNPK